jgi:hypothetical protein
MWIPYLPGWSNNQRPALDARGSRRVFECCTMRLNLIWNRTDLLETEWIRDLLGGLDLTERVSSGRTIVLPLSIVVDGPLSRMPAAYLEQIGAVGNCVLLELSDESYLHFAAPCNPFNLVIRNYASPFFRDPRVRFMPLGYANAFAGCAAGKPAAERQHVWSFVGSTKATRREMLKRLVGIVPNRVHITGDATGDVVNLTPAEYREIVGNTAFLPCPMGNYNLESFRIYEALQAGAIPILEERRTYRYFRQILGESPLPFVRTWAEGREFVARIARSTDEMNILQSRCGDWWREFVLRERARVQDLILKYISGPSRPPSRRGVARRLTGNLMRAIELSRHQCATSYLWIAQFLLQRRKHS